MDKGIRLDGKRDRRVKSVTDRLEAARRSRFRIIRARNIFLLWAIAESKSEAHLEPLEGERTDYWQAALCIHMSTGQLSFKLTSDDMAFFGHLQQRAKSHWEGHKAEENYERIQARIEQLRKPVLHSAGKKKAGSL